MALVEFIVLLTSHRAILENVEVYIGLVVVMNVRVVVMMMHMNYILLLILTLFPPFLQHPYLSIDLFLVLNQVFPAWLAKVKIGFIIQDFIIIVMISLDAIGDVHLRFMHFVLLIPVQIFLWWTQEIIIQVHLARVIFQLFLY